MNFSSAPQFSDDLSPDSSDQEDAHLDPSHPHPNQLPSSPPPSAPWFKILSNDVLFVGGTTATVGLLHLFLSELRKRHTDGQKVSFKYALMRTLEHFVPTAKNIKNAKILYAGVSIMLLSALLNQTKRFDCLKWFSSKVNEPWGTTEETGE
ncbi:hypothetical protein ACFLY6_01780 [Candidatus Dependentiae bacterium]